MKNTTSSWNYTMQFKENYTSENLILKKYPWKKWKCEFWVYIKIWKEQADIVKKNSGSLA
jgi:hypothetical protein